MAEEKNTYLKLLEEERANSAAYETRVNVKLVFVCLFLLEPSSEPHVVLWFLWTDWEIGEIQWEATAEQEKDSGSTHKGTSPDTLKTH